MELQPIGNALSMTNSSLLAIESMCDLTQAIIEREGVVLDLHFAQIDYFYTHLQTANGYLCSSSAVNSCRSCRMSFYNLERECWRTVLSRIPRLTRGILMDPMTDSGVQIGTHCTEKVCWVTIIEESRLSWTPHYSKNKKKNIESISIPLCPT